MKRGVLPVVLGIGQLENVSKAVGAVAERCSIQISCIVKGEKFWAGCKRHRAIQVLLPREAVEQRECPRVTDRRQFEHGSTTPTATVSGGAVEISHAVECET